MPIKIVESASIAKTNDIYSPVDLVLVEDNEDLSNKMVLYIFKDKIVDQYLCPEDLLKNIHRYSKTTKIYLDNNYDNSGRKGVDVAQELHEKGYERLYLLSGEIFKEGELPDYLIVLRKDDIEGIENSL